MSSVVGAELYILHLKYLKNEREQVSLYEIQPDRALNNLSGIVIKSMQSKFLASRTGFVYNLNYVDTFQYILMDLIKGLRFHGWRLITSHALTYTSNTSDGGLVTETSFFFEINALDFILMMNSNSVTTSEVGTNGVSNHNSKISGMIGSLIDGSKYEAYEAKTSMESPPRYNVSDSGITTERDEFGEFNSLGNGNVGASTGVNRIPQDAEYASILLDKSATSQTGPYGFARIHSMQTGHSPKPRVDPARNRMPAAPPVPNSLAPRRPSESAQSFGDGASASNDNHSTSPPNARKSSLVFAPRTALTTSVTQPKAASAIAVADPAVHKSVASPSKTGIEQSLSIPAVASTTVQGVPVLEKQPSAADKLFQKYSHRKSVVLSPRKSSVIVDAAPVASHLAPLHTTPVGDSAVAVADVGTVKPSNTAVDTPAAPTAAMRPSAVPAIVSPTTITSSGTSAANKLFQKYSQHRKPSLYRTPSQGNVLSAGQPAADTGTAREISAVLTADVVKPSPALAPQVVVASDVSTAPSKTLSNLFATATTESVIAEPAMSGSSVNPTASNPTERAELKLIEGQISSYPVVSISPPTVPVLPATLPDTILVHHSQLAAVVGEQNVRRSIGGFHRVKSNSISGQNLLTLLAASQGEVGVVETVSASTESVTTADNKHDHHHRHHGIDDDDDEDYGDLSRINKISDHGHEEGEDQVAPVAAEKKTERSSTPVISLTAAPLSGPEPQFSPMPATKPPLGPARNHSLRGSLSLKSKPQPVDMNVDPFSSAGSNGSVSSGGRLALDSAGLRAHGSGSEEEEDYGDLTQIRAIEHGAEVDTHSSGALLVKPPLDVPKPPPVDESRAEVATPVAVLVPVAIPIAQQQNGSVVVNVVKDSDRVSSGAVLPAVSAIASAGDQQPVVSEGTSAVAPVSEETDGIEKPLKKRPSLFLAPNPMDATIKGSSLFAKAAVDNSTPEEKQAEMLHQSSRTQHYSKLGSAFVSDNVLSVRGGMGGRGRGAGRGVGIR